MYNRFESEETNVENSSGEARRLLESYLERACAADNPTVPAQDQADLRREMSGHIQALAAAHEELGATPEEAMQAALRQFGEAEVIGKGVAREMGQRSSWLGSPLTVSMVGGCVINLVALPGINAVLANTQLDVISPTGQLFGIALGCIASGVIWKRRKSVREAALWNARFCTGATFASIVALFVFAIFVLGNQSAKNAFYSLWWWRLAGPALLQWLVVAGLAGALSGALTGLWCRLVRH